MLDRSLSPPAQPAGAPLWSDRPIEVRISPGLTPYPTALEEMERRAAALEDGSGGELVWMLQHPPLYTRGVSAKSEDLLAPDRFPVFESPRGGQFTYHGPGQRVVYLVLDLRARGRDVHAFVRGLETWLIRSLADLGVIAGARPGRVGVWVDLARSDGPSEAKIAAIGVRLRRWISTHGVSLNVEPELEHFEGIVPCGIREHGVTSLAALGRNPGIEAVDAALLARLSEQFGPLRQA